MNKDIDESLRYLFEEYKRLKVKEKKQKLTVEEHETLKKLSSFLGVNVAIYCSFNEIIGVRLTLQFVVSCQIAYFLNNVGKKL